MRVLVPFTRDLRVRDHPALSEACAVGDEVVPAFVLDDGLLRGSPNRARFLLESLVDLDGSLRKRGGRLHVRRADAVDGAVSLARDLACDAVFLTADVTRLAAQREAALRSGLTSAGIELRLFPGNAVVDPGEAAPEGKTAYRVFTPYWRAWSSMPKPAVLPPPAKVPVPQDVPPGAAIIPGTIASDALDLPPGGETPGRRRMNAFLTNDVASYATARDRLADDDTSRLSPYLRFGCISANEVASRTTDPRAKEFLRQLCWRDFFRQLLASDPSLAWRGLRPAPISSNAIDPEHALQAWREGATGIPLVDAGMRQLQREGWMHNRARLVVGSFLTRRLGVPWQDGARHFLRLLVDGDPANNAGGWQWVAGTGADPRRSRPFNPVRQARRYDPDGVFVRRYVRELADAPKELVVEPWRDPNFLRERGYPEPIHSVPVS